MSKCYYSDDEITPKNESVEHIIPNFLGGKLKSKKLLTNKANNELGNEIDAPLAKAISLHTILETPRENGKNPSVRAQSIDGTRYIYNGGDQAIKAPRKPKIETDDQGNITAIEFLAGQEKEIVKLAKRKFPEMTKEEIRAKFTYSSYPKPTEIYFDNHLNILSKIDEFRAIAKIAVSFAIHITDAPELCPKAIDFVKKATDEGGIVSYYYPEATPYFSDENEISHVLHLRGSHAERLFYCYIELYNSHKFIVVLNDDYDGPDLEETYIFDVRNKEVLQKEVDLKITRPFLKKYNHHNYDLERMYFQNVEATLGKAGLKMSRTNISKLEDRK